MKKFIIPSVFTAVDKVSAVTKGMSKSVSDYASKSDDALARTNRRYRKLGESAFNVSRQSALVGAAIIAPLGLAVKAAIDFEDKMADVAKVANVALGSMEFNRLGDEAKQLSIFLGVSAEDAAGLMANLAQGGVAINDLNEVSKIAGKVGVAFGVSADLAGEAFVKTRNALGGTIAETEKLMDSINFLGNTTAASSANLLTFMSSGGSGVARAAGASGEALAGMGAQLISMGKSAEESATIMERFIKTTLSNSDIRKVFDDAGGGSAGMMKVIENGAKMSGAAQDAYFQEFGQYGISLQLLAKNFTQLESTVDAATNAQKTAGSVQQEFENRTNTTAFKLQKMKAQLMAVAIDIGSALLPAVIELANSITPIIQRFAGWSERNRDLLNIIVKVAAAVGAFALVISFVSFAVGIYSKAMLLANGLTKAWAAAQMVLNVILTANPIGIIIVAIGLLIAAIAYVASKTTGWAETWDSAVKWMTAVGDFLYNSLAAYFLSIQHVFISVVDAMVLAWKWGQNKIGLLSDEQYAKDKSNIEAQGKAREEAIKNSIIAAGDAADRISQGIDFQVRMNDAETPVLNEKQSAMDAQTEKLIKGQMTSSLDVNLAPGLMANSMSPNVNVNSSSTK